MDDASAMGGLDALEHLHRVLERVGVPETNACPVELLVEGLGVFPSRYSITMNARPDAVWSTSLTRTTCALWIRAETRASRRKRDEAGAAGQLRVEKLEGDRRPLHLVAGFVDAPPCRHRR